MLNDIWRAVNGRKKLEAAREIYPEITEQLSSEDEMLMTPHDSALAYGGGAGFIGMMSLLLSTGAVSPPEGLVITLASAFATAALTGRMVANAAVHRAVAKRATEAQEQKKEAIPAPAP